MFFCDAHIHIASCSSVVPDSFCCSCAHSPEEFIVQERKASESGGRIIGSFGIHPQNPLLSSAEYLESLLMEKHISAVGETGFDFFTPELRANSENQIKAFEICAGLASGYKVPVVIHDRKALDLIFSYSSVLRACVSVVFHSFPFGPADALSILRHGINAYFSFGKQLLNGNKRAEACVRELPAERILLETDAPYQTLRNETATDPFQIKDIYARAALIRRISLEELSALIADNFFSAFDFSFPKITKNSAF